MTVPNARWTGFYGDDQIQRDVTSQLMWDARVIPNEIGVNVRNGVVVLTGQVDAYPKRWAAEEAALGIRGVRAVANDIEVRLQRSATRADADIAAAALRALEWDAMLPRNHVQVSVSNAWLTLSGEVEWQHQKVDVERIVHRLTGVRGVSNSIRVKPRVNAADIKEQIEQALSRATTIESSAIEVAVSGRNVKLEGHVRSLAEAQEAVRLAWLAPGVGAVDDRLAVS